jgi:hypothetical protein
VQTPVAPPPPRFPATAAGWGRRLAKCRWARATGAFPAWRPGAPSGEGPGAPLSLKPPSSSDGLGIARGPPALPANHHRPWAPMPHAVPVPPHTAPRLASSCQWDTPTRATSEQARADSDSEPASGEITASGAFRRVSSVGRGPRGGPVVVFVLRPLRFNASRKIVVVNLEGTERNDRR